MNPNDALELLSSKLQEHGLAKLGWTGALDSAVRRFGACTYGKKAITLSRNLVAINSAEEVLDTVLHEIAHALAREEHGADCGHDARWKAIATRIGARPERTVDAEEVSSVGAAFFLVHSETGEVFASYYKRPAREYSGAWVPGRRAETEGKLEVVSARQLALIQKGGGGTSAICSFDRGTVKTLSDALHSAISEVCKVYNLEAKLEAGRFDPATYTFSCAVKVPAEHAEDGDRAEFARHCQLFGLTASDFGRSFDSRGKRFFLCGIKPRNRKYPIIAHDSSGGRYKFGADVLTHLAAP